MNTFARRSLGALDIAGGALAVSLFVSQLIAVPPNLFAYIGTSAYVVLACWGIFAGILLLERDPRARLHNLVFWSCQVPIVFIPGIGHKLGIGAFLFAWVEYPIRFSAFFGTGAQFSFRLFKIEDPTVLGVNVVALVVVCWLYRSLPAAAPSSPPDGT